MISGDTEMLDIDEVARHLGVSVARVRELAASGALKSYSIAGELRFQPFEVELYSSTGHGLRDDPGRARETHG